MTRPSKTGVHRLDNRRLMAEEVGAWEDARNARKARIHWTFTSPFAY